MIQCPIILASKSPRRRFLLEEADISFSVQTKDVEENYPDDLAVASVPEFLAKKKAKACADFIKNDEILIAADSVVIMDNQIYGKPKDAQDAFEIIQKLSNNTHIVVTGVCLLSKDKFISFSDTSIVHFNTITTAEINHYINKYKPFDKAGAYGIQEWIGWCKINKIEGSYANIMGLPIHRVYDELKRF